MDPQTDTAILSPQPLPYEPAPAFQTTTLQDDSALADCQGKRIGILIVTYNAVSTIKKVLKRITPNVWKNVEEVVIFDDASPDPTFELAMGIKMLTDVPKLHILKHPKNLGYGGNQKAGYQYFIERGFDVVVLLHGDGQYAPELLAHMYKPIVEGKADAVFGSRMMKTYGGPLKCGMPLYKYLGNRVLTVVENAALGLNLTEFHSGYRAYNLHALKLIDFSQMTDEFHFDTEIIIKLHHQGFHIHEIPIPTYYGDEICYVNGMKYARDVFRAVYRYNQTRRSVRAYPEYREYFVNYALKRNTYSSHHFARQFVTTDEDVLEIGCGHGLLSRELIEKGNRVWGVDLYPPEEVALDRDSYRQVNLQIEGLQEVQKRLGGRTFDTILFLDILEHTVDPMSILRQALAMLKPEGQIIVSVPNVAHFTVRLKLMLGRFEYQERGILDQSHLRFFTRKSLRKLIERAGYSIVRQRMAVIPIELITGLSISNPIMRVLHGILVISTKLMPSAMGYQTLVIAKPRNQSSA